MEFSSQYLPTHGGDLDAANVRFGLPERGWLDLSTGINPIHYNFEELPPTVFTRLPDQSLSETLIVAAKSYYRTSSAIVPGAGSQAFIRSLPNLFEPTEVAILAPTYSEHEKAWKQGGHSVSLVDNIEALAQYQVAIVVNPNNPTGHAWPTNDLIKIGCDLEKKGGILIVDEAFCDVQPGISLAPILPIDGVVVLRSFGKFFGLAGIRLGFVLCSHEFAEQLSHSLGPWPVSGPALSIGAQALRDSEWHTQTRSRLTSDCARLDEIFERFGNKVIGGTDLFRLIATDGRMLHEHLAQQGIWTRVFHNNSNILRCGLPGNDADWCRLEAALSVF